MQFIHSSASKKLLLSIATLAMTKAAVFATGTSFTTGVDTNNNIVTTTVGSTTTTQDTNWSFVGYFDSYGLTRGQVFGSSVSEPERLDRL